MELHVTLFCIFQVSYKCVIILSKFKGKCCWENWTVTSKKNEIRTFFDIIHKDKIKMDKDLSVRLDNIKQRKTKAGHSLT